MIDFSDPSVLARRKPVWVAISDLCLDTEITDGTIAYIARTIQEQGFSSEEAEYIAFHEVFPAVAFNLMSVAGEWAGFQDEWLFETIIKKSSRFGRLVSLLRQKLYRSLLQRDWDRVLAALSCVDGKSVENP